MISFQPTTYRDRGKYHRPFTFATNIAFAQLIVLLPAFSVYTEVYRG